MLMKVLFDSAIMAQQEFGGVSKYFLEMSGRLDRHDVEHRLFAPLFINQHLHHLSDRHTFGIGVRATRLNRKTASMLGKVTLPLAAALYRPDIIHQTLYDMPHPRRARCPTVITIHDMIQELFAADFPGSKGWIARKRNAIAQSDWIICDSRNTETDLLRLYPEAVGRTSVVYLAGSLPPVTAAPPASRDPYLLYVGHRGGYKNFVGFLAAYASSPRLQRDLRVVCAGGGPFSAAEQKLLADAGVADRVSQTGASDEELVGLYRDAAVFIYPSLYEGFGIPPLEAMSCDCPVIALREGSVPEVCGDGVQSPASPAPDDLRDAIEGLVYGRALRDELIVRGRRRVADFSWDKCARDTAAVYRHVVAARSYVFDPTADQP